MSVDGEEGVFQLAYLYKGQTYYMSLSEETFYTKTVMTTDQTDQYTYFTFEETQPAPEPVKNDWENEEVFAVGKEPGHATYMPYESTEALRADAERYAKPSTP